MQKESNTCHFQSHKPALKENGGYFDISLMVEGCCVLTLLTITKMFKNFISLKTHFPAFLPPTQFPQEVILGTIYAPSLLLQVLPCLKACCLLKYI